MTVRAEPADHAALVTQGLRAGDLLLSRVIVVLEDARANALSSDEPELAAALGRTIGAIRSQCIQIEGLISARCGETAMVEGGRHAIASSS